MAIESVDPATGERLRTFQPHSDDEVNQRLARAAEAFAHWSRQPVAARARVVGRAAEILHADKRDLALLMTREMGKPLAEAEAEVEKCAAGCRYYAEHGEEFLR